MSSKYRAAQAGLGDANPPPTPPHEGPEKAQETLSQGAKTPSEDARKVTAWKKYESWENDLWKGTKARSRNAKVSKPFETSLKNHCPTKSAISAPKNLPDAPQKPRQKGQDAFWRGPEPEKMPFRSDWETSFWKCIAWTAKMTVEPETPSGGPPPGPPPGLTRVYIYTYIYIYISIYIYIPE